MKKFLQILTQFLLILFGIISFVLLIIVLFRPEWIKIAIEWIGNIIETLGNWNYLIAFLSALIESLPIIGSLVPGMNIMVLIGGFWWKIHLIETIIFASAWAMLGNYFGYWIWKKYGKHIIENYGEYIGIGKTEQKILEKQIEKNGFWYIVLGKFHGTLRAFIPFIAGAWQMAEKNFWLYNSIWSIIWATTINLLWVFFIDQYEVILDNFWKITSAVIIIILLYLWFFKKEAVKQYWIDKNNELNEKLSQSQK